MKVTLDVSKAVDALGIRAAQESKAAAAAITGVVRHLTFGIRKDMKAEIRRALGARAANALRAKVTPGPSSPNLTPAGRVYSNFVSKKRPGGPVDVLAVFQDGATISAGGNKWLAIPLEAAGRKGIGGSGKLGDRAPRPSDFRGRLTFVPVRGKPDVALLVARTDTVHGAKRGEALFMLVRKVVLKQRYDLRAIYDKRLATLPEIVEQAYRTERQKAGVL